MEVVQHIGNPYRMQRTHTAPVHPTAADAAGGADVDRSRFGATPHHRMPPSHPAHQSPLVHSQGHTSSSYSIQSQQSSRNSDTTQGTSHSTLFPPPPPPPPPPPIPGIVGAMATGGVPNGGNDVTATDNVMNSVADASSSLFQICVSLGQRLHGVPGLGESMYEEEQDADEDTDPVTLLWRTFRRGYPLLLLYNALQPIIPLEVPLGVKEEKRGKAASFKFLQACVSELKFPQEECFIITDLYGDDTTGFVKVARVVNRVLDLLVSRGLIDDVRPTASDFEQAEKGMKRTQRQHIVSELVTTERTYVQHLELLQAFKHLVEEKGVIAGDAVHDIFLNLNSLLDFQRRFLIRVEQTNALPEEEQNWGKLFVLYCDAFKVYEPYIANQKKCEKIVVAEFAKLKEAGGSLEMRQMVESSTSLYGFLMKPFQRLSKYPLLLEDLYKKGDLDEERRADLQIGKEAATSVLSRTNQAVDREEKAEAVQELKMRVEDWKGHRVEAFGELLLYGTFTVLKSDSLAGGKDAERQYHVYLFETILLCCKDIDLSKPKNKLSNRQLTDKRGKPKMQLKGRIFMQNVTDLVTLNKPGSYTCQIFWKGDPSIENFIIRFTTEDALKKWSQQIDGQRRRYQGLSVRNSDVSKLGGTSVTEFEFMRNQPVMENPYARQADDEEDDDDMENLIASSSFSAPGAEFDRTRNGSSPSSRSRSTTGDSTGMAPSISGRSQAPRFYAGSVQSQTQAQLSLRTRELQQAALSPSEQQRPPESYFSPVVESPLSSVRTSASSSSVYMFPRQQMPTQNGYYDEGHGHTRFTAPAVARREREPSGSGGVQSTNGHPPSIARAPRPGTMHSSQQAPLAPRNRSASTPDIHERPRGAHGPRGVGLGEQPPVPNMPATYQQNPHVIPRSQNNSPNLVNGIAPPRGPLPNRGPDSSPTDWRYNVPGAVTVPQRSDLRGSQYPNSRTGTPSSIRGESFSQPQQYLPYSTPHPTPPPPPPSATPSLQVQDSPTQLKVKVHCPAASQVLTLVVPLNITYQSLKDRIDAKLQRSTNISLGDRGPKENQVKLKYLDDDDFVSIQSDEDVQTAFETWKEQRGHENDSVGGMGEIELFCQR